MANIPDAAHDELIGRQIAILRTAEGLTADYVAALSAAEDKIMRLLQRTDLTRFTRQRTVSLLNDIRRVLADFAGAQYTRMANDVSKVALLTAARTARDLNDLFKIEIFEPVLSANSLKKLLDQSAILGGQTLANFWERAPDRLLDVYSSVIRTGVLTNRSKAEMLRDIEEAPGITASRGWLRTMVRSSVMNIANESRIEMYAENLDIVKGLTWVSTLDGRTTPICRSLDGLSWSLPDYEPIGHDKRYPGPIAHPNCRSTQIPLLRSFAEMATKNKALAAKLDQALSSGSRASLDGQVPATRNYEDWLRSRKPSEARDILGDARYNLWSAGRMTVRDLTNQVGRELSIAELEDEFS